MISEGGDDGLSGGPDRVRDCEDGDGLEGGRRAFGVVVKAAEIEDCSGLTEGLKFGEDCFEVYIGVLYFVGGLLK